MSEPSADTGTVTVTVMYDDSEWADTDITLLDGETEVAIGYSDEYGVAILTDDITATPIVAKQIPYGTYTLQANAGVYSYEGSLVVDSAEVATTITLTEPSSSGTLTVTTLDSEETPVEGSMVFVSDEEYSDIAAFMDAIEEDPTIGLGVGMTDNTGEALIMTIGESLQPVEPEITFESGAHYLYAVNLSSEIVYVGTVNINGDTTTTITLTAA